MHGVQQFADCGRRNAQQRKAAQHNAVYCNATQRNANHPAGTHEWHEAVIKRIQQINSEKG